MKAYRLKNDGGACRIEALPLPSLHRGQHTDAEPYRLQAAGKLPMPEQNLDQASGLRAIRLSGSGDVELFNGAAPGLFFVIAGELALRTSREDVLEPGDVLLAECGARPGWSTIPGTILVRLDVEAQWPGTDAVLQDEGTPTPRDQAAPKIMRIYEGADHRSYLAGFPEFLPVPDDVWSDPRPVLGFRFLRFPDGAFIDWHPEVVNNFAIFLSGEMEIEARGSNPIEYFRTGDILLAEDRKGEGHIDRMHGDIHLALIVMDNQALWAFDKGEGQ
ncbi:MAG: hypothetical protein R3D83_03645 [Caenibius sp.]